MYLVFLFPLPPFFPLNFKLHLYPSLLSPFTPISPVLPHPPSLLFCPSFSNTNSSGPPPHTEPSRPPGGPEGRGHGEESEPSDDEILSLSSQQSNTSTAAAAKPSSISSATTSVEADLLGLGGEAMDPTGQTSHTASIANTNTTTGAAATTDLLGDLFGAPASPASAASSAKSTPHKVVANGASPCPSPAPAGDQHTAGHFWGRFLL